MQLELDHPTLCLGVVSADDVQVEASPAPLLEQLALLEGQLAADPALFPEAVRSAVRDVLRKGGYKPTGRGKPASEYLFGQAQQRSLPRINNLVDICNLVSLRHAFPISVFDVELLGSELAVRFGKLGEQYVFNTSGQSMDIAGLPVVCRGPAREPVGNAVKDSMACKVHAGTRSALYVVYGGRSLLGQLRACLVDLSRVLQVYAHTDQVAGVLIPADV